MEKEIHHQKSRLKNPSLQKLKFWLPCALSFVIVAFGQPAWEPILAPCCAAFGYALCWKVLFQISSSKHRFWAATLWFALVQAIQLSWMTSFEYQGYYILGVYLGLILFLGVQFGILTHFVCRGVLDPARICALSSLWAIAEWARLHFLCGFSWNPAGMALAAFPVSMQLAAVFGVFGLSFWVIATNLALVRGSRRAWILLALFPYFFGALHLVYQDGQHRNAGDRKQLSVALVQTALLPSQKNVLHGRESDFIPLLEQWKDIFSLLGSIPSNFDLIVLPEAALPFGADFSLRSSQAGVRVSNASLAQGLAQGFNAEVVVGLEAREGGKSYNAAFHFVPAGAGGSRYDKRVLLPLAEYLPFEWLRPLVKRYGVYEFFSKGQDAVIFNGRIPLSASICYEETFGDLMREGRKKGAALFVNVTNDQWYPFSRLARQHLHHAKLRAVENGLPLVRACNGGMSAVIDPLGRILASMQEGEKGVLDYTLITCSHRTLYTLWGDKGILLVSVSFVLFYLSVRLKKRITRMGGKSACSKS